MSNSRYYVVGNQDVWVVQYNDMNDRCQSSGEAALIAIAAAQKLGMRGERAHVCALDDNGRLQCKWSYDRDRRLLS
jgi:hypothetical protein